MKVAYRYALVALMACFMPTMVAAEQEVDQEQMDAREQSVVLFAQQQGVEIGKAFSYTPELKALADLLLGATGQVEATCSVTCRGGAVGAIACPIGKMCVCSCPGGGPDCSCRN